MRTGDGLLVRLHPANGVLRADQLGAIARGAAEDGNGFVDVTSRANLQIRGVRPASQPRLAARLAAAGLADPRPPGGRFPDGPQRLTLASPLAGLDPTARFDAAALAVAIEEAARDLAGLHPKLLVAIEDGGRAGIGGIEADIVIRPAPGDREAVTLGLAGGSAVLDADVATVPDLLRTLLARLATLGPHRMRDLAAADRETLLGARQGPSLQSVSAPSLAPGRLDLGPQSVAVAVELPFGRGDASLLDAVAGWAVTLGDGSVRLTPTRGLLLVGLTRDGANAVLAAAAARGLITDPDDPRRAVAACPGAPACASGAAPAQDDATRIAALLGSASADGARPRIHVSGCAKGCAHPGRADLTLVADASGYGIVANGRAGDEPVAHGPLAAILSRLAHDPHSFDDVARGAP